MSAEVKTLEAVMEPYRAQPFATPQQVEAGIRWLADTMLSAIREAGVQEVAVAAPASPAFLDREGMAAALSVSLTTFDAMRKEPGFPEINMGGGRTRGAVRFDPEAVKAYINEQARVRREMER